MKPAILLLVAVPLLALAHAEDKPAPKPSAPPPLPLPETVSKDAKLEEVYRDDRMFFEGPTWDPQTQKLYFTAFIRKDGQILRLDEPGKATPWLNPSEGVNGTFLSKDGRLLGAQAFGHRIMSYAIGADGPRDARVLHENKELFQPNDLCETRDGRIYFTDPDFKNKQASAVYVLHPDGKTAKLITEMPVPNGVEASLDGKTLYVADSSQKLWRSYPVKDDGTLGEGKVFFNPDCESKADPDGMTIDEKGNLYFTGRGGVWCVSPEGKGLGFIPVPEFASNCSFGGEEGRTLYITCSKKVYALKMDVKGGR